jgi:copper chaperone
MNTNITKLTAPDIVCGGCANSIKKTLANLAGVSGVEVDVNAKIVTVEYREPASLSGIIDTLDRAGYSTT